MSQCCSLSNNLLNDTVKYAGSEKGREKKAESEQGGIGGRGRGGAGLGLNAPLRFGVLMENCGRAGPTAATVAAAKKQRPDQTRSKKQSWKREETKGPEGAGLTEQTLIPPSVSTTVKKRVCTTICNYMNSCKVRGGSSNSNSNELYTTNFNILLRV